MPSSSPNTVYTFRSISESVDTALSQKFGQPLVGHTSPRQSWGRALIYLGALDTERSIAAYILWQRALQIASSRRGDKYLRDEKLIREKYEQELPEFHATLEQYRLQISLLCDVANRLASLLYYLVQIYSIDGNLGAFDRNTQSVCQTSGFQEEVAFSIAVEKFTSRGQRAAVGLAKDETEEYRRMQRILDQFAHLIKIQPQNP